MIVTCDAIQAAEKRLFEAGVEVEPLMERAGKGCAEAIRQWFPRPCRAILFVGKGNNGGDALVIGRELRKRGWSVVARYAGSASEMTDLAAKKREEFEAVSDGDAFPRRPLILVDGLLGIGAQGPLRGGLGELAMEMNQFRLAECATTFAVDFPSGVDGDSGEPYPGAVVADVTLTISAVKAGLVADRAIDHVGRLVLVPLPEIAAEVEGGDTTAMVPDTTWLRERLPRRSFSSHKGQAGRVAIVAGSKGFTGAAKLCALGALHGGAGLVTVFATEAIYPILAAAAPPEVMVRPMSGYADVLDFSADVIAVGPGLGASPFDSPGLRDLLIEETRPVVIDADALNFLSRTCPEIETFRPSGPRLLTPHPGEMTRLLGEGAVMGRDRQEVAAEWVEKVPMTLLFKGARTVVAEEGHPLSLNPTGHPGMATGGIGDVLTGLCAALAGQGMTFFDAAVMGSWLIGRAAEQAIQSGSASTESLSAGDIAGHLGSAFEGIRRRDW